MPYDMTKLLKNLDTIYNSPTAFSILKEFERVLDEYDIYVYNNWKTGELLAGPHTTDYWVTCYFMWPEDCKPDCSVLEKLSSVGIKSKQKSSSILVPRKIRKPDDIRPGTKKGKFDRKKIHIVGIKIPKELINSVYNGRDIFKSANDEQEIEAAAPAQPAAPDMGLGGLGAPVAPGVI